MTFLFLNNNQLVSFFFIIIIIKRNSQLVKCGMTAFLYSTALLTWPSGAAGTLVVCEASHMCMVARGVEKHASSTITMAVRGACEQDIALRSRLLERLTR